MGKKVVAIEIEKERTRRFIKIVESLTSIGRTVLQFGFLYLVVRELNQMVVVLAGKTTSADININFLTKVFMDGRINSSLNLTGWIFGIYYGYSQRKARQKDVQRFQKRIQELEVKLDPSRTSSRLTSKGETRPEDK